MTSDKRASTVKVYHERRWRSNTEVVVETQLQKKTSCGTRQCWFGFCSHYSLRTRVLI